MKTGFGDNDPDEEDSEDQSDKDDNEPAAKKGRLGAEKAPTLNPDVTDLDQSNKYDDVATTMSKKKKTHPNKSLGKYLFLFSRPPSHRVFGEAPRCSNRFPNHFNIRTNSKSHQSVARKPGRNRLD